MRMRLRLWLNRWAWQAMYWLFALRLRLDPQLDTTTFTRNGTHRNRRKGGTDAT